MTEVKVCGNLDFVLATDEMRKGKVVQRFFDNKPKMFYAFVNNFFMFAETATDVAFNKWNDGTFDDMSEWNNSTFCIVTIETSVRVIYEV